MNKLICGMMLAGTCACGAFAAQSPNAWNGAVATGDWSVDSNWSLGHKPDSGNTVYVTNMAAAVGYDVTLDVPWTSVATNALVIGNATGTATNTLTIASALVVERDKSPSNGDSFWDIQVNKGGRIVLEDGGSLIRRKGKYGDYNAPDTWNNYFLKVSGGGSFLQTGGLLNLRENTQQGILVGDTSGSATSRWEMTGGVFDWANNGTSYAGMHIRETGRFEMSGTAVFTNSQDNAKYRMMAWRMQGGVASLSGHAKMVLNHGNYHFIGWGQTTVRDEAQLFSKGSSPHIIVAPRNEDPAGSVACIDILDDARFSFTGDSETFLIGGQKGKSGIVTYASTRTDGSLGTGWQYVGVNAGYGELNVVSGALSAGKYTGVHIGADDCNGTVGNGVYASDWTRESNEHAAPTGLVRVSGGKLTVGGHATQAWNYRYLTGLVVGDGSRVLGTLTDPFEDRLYNGRMEVSGGSVEVESHLAVGAGRAVGSFLQTGGTVLVTGNCDTPMLVGVAGGYGDYVFSNGTLTVKSSLHVGGATPYMLRRSGWDESHGYGEPTGNNYPAGRHDAKGRMVVAGFDSASPTQLAVAKTITVSSDGAGTFEVGGSYATVTAKDMIVSNAVSEVEGGESKIRFVADANGLSPITLSGSLSIADDAKLEVDMSAYAGIRSTKFKIFDCKTRTGAFSPSNVTLVNCRFVQDDGDPDIYVKAGGAQGMTLIVR